MNHRRGAIILAIILTLGILGALCFLAPMMHPVRRASAADFWTTVGCIDLGGHRAMGPGIAALHNQRFVYTAPGMDDIWLDWVPEAEVTASWPIAEAEFERLSVTAPERPQAIAYQRWKALPVNQRKGVLGLTRAIDAEISERMARENPSRLVAEDLFADERQAAASCAEKMDWYWATFCFEFLYLSGLIWWILWPAIRGSGLIRYMVHWSLAPTLVVLPTWLGYATPIPHIRETGGILYSWLTLFLGRPDANAAWEVAFFSHLPRVLEPLSQHAWIDLWGPNGWHRLGFNMHGPLSAMLAGGVVLVLLAFGAIWHRYVLIPGREKHRPQGFEVVPAPPDGVTAATPAANTTVESSPPAPAPARRES